MRFIYQSADWAGTFTERKVANESSERRTSMCKVEHLYPRGGWQLHTHEKSPISLVGQRKNSDKKVRRFGTVKMLFGGQVESEMLGRAQHVEPLKIPCQVGDIKSSAAVGRTSTSAVHWNSGTINIIDVGHSRECGKRVIWTQMARHRYGGLLQLGSINNIGGEGCNASLVEVELWVLPIKTLS